MVRRASPRFFHLVASAVFVALTTALPAETPLPDLPKQPEGLRLLEAWASSFQKSPGKAWVPMSGSLPVEPAPGLARPVLKMPCRFAGNQVDRSSWDLPMKVDLTEARGLQLLVYCPDPSPVSGFSLYLRSGKGWYSSRFSTGSAGKWRIVQIEKPDTNIEDEPTGWRQIDAVRISAWRGRDRDTDLFIADLAYLDGSGPIAILRGETAPNDRWNERKAAIHYASVVRSALDRAGLPYSFISDRDAAAGRLAGKKLAILPHNPGMPQPTIDALLAFLKSGGKLLSFYGLPGKLREAVGIPGGKHIPQQRRGMFASIHANLSVLPGAPEVTSQRSWNITESKALPGRSRVGATWFDEAGKSTGQAAIVVSKNCVLMTHVLIEDDWQRKPQLLLAMLGALDPEMWQTAARARLERMGRVGPYRSLDDARTRIREMSQGKAGAVNWLENASRLAGRARELFNEGKYPEVLETAGKVEEALKEAACVAQHPAQGEFRAFWCHNAFGVKGKTWDEAIRILAENGFTAIFPNMLWGGTAYFPSEVLPVAKEVAERGDQIQACLAACRKYGIECHVWKVNWNMSVRAPKAFASKMKKEGRVQVSFTGKPNDQWLCPSHPANQQLEIAAMVEVAKKYAVDGLHFDYIRYPGPSYCFCQGCRERFEAQLGRKVAHWPQDTRNDEETRSAWNRFRQGNITRVVKAVSERARRARPGIRISAAVFRNYAVDRFNVAQDWKLWCEKGYLDFVCPMDYTPDTGHFENLVRQQQDLVRGVPVYPGIGVSTWKTAGKVWTLIDQVGVTRALKTGGFIIFNYGVPEAGELVPLCGKGLTRRRP